MPKRISSRQVFHSFFMAVCCFFLAVSSAKAAEVTLSWAQSSSGATAGYTLHYGTTSGSYDTVIDAGNSLRQTVSNLAIGETYYFAAKAYDDSGSAHGFDSGDQQSGFSNEISYTVKDTDQDGLSDTDAGQDEDSQKEATVTPDSSGSSDTAEAGTSDKDDGASSSDSSQDASGSSDTAEAGTSDKDDGTSSPDSSQDASGSSDTAEADASDRMEQPKRHPRLLISSGRSLSVKSAEARNRKKVVLALIPEEYAGQVVDWWIVADTPFGLFSLVADEGWKQGLHPAAQMELDVVHQITLIDAPLPKGDYAFYFAVDDNADGHPDATWYDVTRFTIGD
jgi:hypothetical protein